MAKEVKIEETAEDEQPNPATPSFRGRLELQSFMFKDEVPLSKSSTMPRRSPRLSITPAAAALTAESPAPPSSRKRKATALVGLDYPAPSPSAETSNSSSPSKKPRRRPKTGYAPPSTYAHLPFLPDAIAPNLLVLFVGLNPGLQTARQGHAYAHPSNLFWKLMYSSGVLPVPCQASEDRSLPDRFSLGLTNIVSRPSRNGAELSKAEMDMGVSVLEDKARRWRPEVVCIVGKSIWESVWRVRHGRAIKKDQFRYGWQDEAENMGKLGPEGMKEEEVQEGVEYRDDWAGAKVFVASSTSGLAATLSPAEKERIWRELGIWVEKRRAGRRGDAPVKEEAISL